MSWHKTAKPGTEIVCITPYSNNDFLPGTVPDILPEKGKVYLFKGVAYEMPLTNDTAIRIIGFKNCFLARNWRPVEHETDEEFLANSKPKPKSIFAPLIGQKFKVTIKNNKITEIKPNAE